MISEEIDENDVALPRTSTRILRPMTPTDADSKIKNDSFHTCKTTVGSPSKTATRRTLRETPQRKAYQNGQTPFRESASGRKLFNKRKHKSQNSSRSSHNDTFSLGIEHFSFDPDSLEAIRCSSVSTVSTFILEEQAAAAAAATVSEHDDRLGSPDFTRSLSPNRPNESLDKINGPMLIVQDPVPKEMPKETVPTEILPKEIIPTEVAKEQKEVPKQSKEVTKAPKEIKPKKNQPPVFQAPRPVRATARPTVRATVMRPTNQTVALRPNIPRRPLSTPSTRRQVEAYKSMAQLEREFERSLRTKEPGSAFSGQFMNQSTRFNMSTRLASSARKL